MEGMTRIGVDEAKALMVRALEARGMGEEAGECARLFSEATLDGVYTHGLERFPRFASYLEKSWVRAGARPSLVAGLGAWERWDGNLGPGNLNAQAAMARAVTLAKTNGMGCVALANTNHWMRGGQYGLQAADSGCLGLCWTNTKPNLPAWGSREAILGNNPLVICVPREGGHVLLDMAMSQFSYGKLEAYAAQGEELPVEGGYDMEGRLTRDPAAILASLRPLPVGFWKGSGLSLLLDLMGTILSGGESVGGLGKRGEEYGLSQVFIAFDPALAGSSGGAAAVEEMEARVRGASPAEGFEGVSFPGERRIAIRAQNLALGLPLRQGLLTELRSLAGV